MTAHALLSPSGADRWMTCPGSVALERDLPDTSSEFADEGTAAHDLAARCLETGLPASGFIGEVIAVEDRSFTVDDEMAGFVQAYVDRTRAAAEGGELFIEQRLSIEHLTGEEDAHGTSDAVIISGTELCIRDLKYGRGVRVEAEGNRQLQIYALAALAEYELVYDIQTVRICIDQPRLNHVSEWVLTVDELRRFGDEVADCALRATSALQFRDGWMRDGSSYYLNPSEGACRFCKAKALCPALAVRVQEEVGAEFDTIAEADVEAVAPSDATSEEVLGVKMRAVGLIEDWCKAVRAEVERRLLAGRDVPGWKLVEGRRGPRQWGDKDEAEQVLKGFRLKVEEMYDLKLITPPAAEKLHKAGKIGPRQWPRLQELITQTEGKPSVAPESDKRPALVVSAVEDEFSDETEGDLV